MMNGLSSSARQRRTCHPLPRSTNPATAAGLTPLGWGGCATPGRLCGVIWGRCGGFRARVPEGLALQFRCCYLCVKRFLSGWGSRKCYLTPDSCLVEGARLYVCRCLPRTLCHPEIYFPKDLNWKFTYFVILQDFEYPIPKACFSSLWFSGKRYILSRLSHACAKLFAGFLYEPLKVCGACVTSHLTPGSVHMSLLPGFLFLCCCKSVSPLVLYKL